MTPTINAYYFHQIVIRRGVDIGGGKRHYVSTGTVDVHLQRIDDRNDSVSGQLYGASHRLWCDISIDIKDGDKVIDSAGNEYLVVGVRTDGVDWAINQHKELFLRIYND
jgi:hypothetical protein